MLVIIAISILVGGLICHAIKPSPPKLCGSANGPPVTSPRISLRDGRFLAYKTRGAAKETAKYKVILSHGFCASKDTYIPLSDNWLQELDICLVTFDRPGYAESDPNPKRSPKNDAYDIQELADQLHLGPKIHVIALSMGSYPFWGCLKYIPHRLAGAAVIAPVINFWWPSLCPEIRSRALRKQALVEHLRLWLSHYSPALAWLLQLCFPFPNLDDILKNNPQAFNLGDLAIMQILSEHTSDKDKVAQQGTYESLHRDWIVSCSNWEFDPLNLSNPLPDNPGSVHLWVGLEDWIVEGELHRHMSRKLPWMKLHEIPHAGHLFIHDKEICEMIFKSLLFGEQPCFG